MEHLDGIAYHFFEFIGHKKYVDCACEVWFHNNTYYEYSNGEWFEFRPNGFSELGFTDDELNHIREQFLKESENGTISKKD